MDKTDMRTIRQLVRSVREGRLTARDVTEESIAQTNELDDEFGCFVSLDLEGARLAATRLDEREIGDDEHLAGVPIGVKENIAVAGLPASAGSPRRRPAATTDAHVVAQLKQSGAIIMGTQQMHELGLGLNTPPTRNAWDVNRYPGGSTAGGAVSVALGMCSAAIGTDTGGSIRKPAALNGIVGFKPSFDRVSRKGVLPPSTSLDHIGILAKTVDDVAAVFRVLNPDSEDGRGQANRGAHRIGVPLNWLEGVRDDVVRAFYASLTTLAAEDSIEIIELNLPLPEEDWEAWSIINVAEAYSQHARRLMDEPESYSNTVRNSLVAGREIGPLELERAYARCEDVRARITLAYTEETLDALATPSTPMPAMPIIDLDWARDLPVYSSLLFQFNMTGQPAISIPSGLSDDGMPLGLQLAGRKGQDNLLLQLASLHERVHSTFDR